MSALRGSRNLEELNGILREHLLIRRLKQDVLHELPPMRRSRRTILPDPDLFPVSPLSLDLLGAADKLLAV